MKKAIVLLSGGLDSAVSLYLAKSKGFRCLCLIFDYGQRHKREVAAAKRIAQAANCKYKVLKIRLPWKGSSLLDKKILLRQGSGRQAGIPATYVPGRNIIFLSFALSYAEAVRAKALFIGAHIQDYSGYPDCRPEFYQAFSRVIATGTKAGTSREKIRIFTPLIRRNKAQIIRLGTRLKVPFALTWSCYQGEKKPCANCDSCRYRAKGFAEAGITDPLAK